jgi:hypothetical protein
MHTYKVAKSQYLIISDDQLPCRIFALALIAAPIARENADQLPERGIKASPFPAEFSVKIAYNAEPGLLDQPTRYNDRVTVRILSSDRRISGGEQCIGRPRAFQLRPYGPRKLNQSRRLEFGKRTVQRCRIVVREISSNSSPNPRGMPLLHAFASQAPIFCAKGLSSSCMAEATRLLPPTRPFAVHENGNVPARQLY